MLPDEQNQAQKGKKGGSSVQVKISSKGSFKNTYKFLKFLSDWKIEQSLKKYAQKGVDALSAATPVDSGKTADSWGYEIEVSKGSAKIHWTNTNTNDGVNIAVILQFGHGTGTGGYVEGRDYINPAIQPIFDEIADALWKEVTTA